MYEGKNAPNSAFAKINVPLRNATTALLGPMLLKAAHAEHTNKLTSKIINS